MDIKKCYDNIKIPELLSILKSSKLFVNTLMRFKGLCIYDNKLLTYSE